MQIVAFLALAGIFLILTVVRVSGARRAVLLRRWPSALLILAAGLELARGGFWIALGLAAAAAVTWLAVPSQAQTKPAGAAADPGDAEARAILGVGLNADAAEIRAAFRARMAQAHPDRGGAHADAARLTAARDRLLRR